MGLSDTIREDLQFIENEMENQVFTWQNNDYICIPNTANEERVLEPGGFSVNADLVLSTRTDQFVTFPTEQEKLVYLEKTYRIIKVGKIALGVYLRLHCMSENRGI